MPTWPSRASFSPAHRITPDDLRAVREKRQSDMHRELQSEVRALQYDIAHDKEISSAEVQTRLEKKLQLARAQRCQMEARQQRVQRELAAIKQTAPSATSLKLSSVERSQQARGRAPGRPVTTEGIEYDYKTEGAKRIFSEKRDSSNVDFAVTPVQRSPQRSPAPPPYALNETVSIPLRVGRRVIQPPAGLQPRAGTGRARSLDRYTSMSAEAMEGYRQQRLRSVERAREHEKQAARAEWGRYLHEERCEQWHERQKKISLKAELDAQVKQQREQRGGQSSDAARCYECSPHGLGNSSCAPTRPTGRSTVRTEKDALASIKEAPVRGRKHVAHTEYSPERSAIRSKSVQHNSSSISFQDVERSVPLVGMSRTCSRSPSRRAMLHQAYKDTRPW